MKLYEIPRGSKILLSIQRGSAEKKDEMCTFHNVDGMYSYISTEQGDAVHLGVMTELKKVNDHYELE